MIGQNAASRREARQARVDQFWAQRSATACRRYGERGAAEVEWDRLRAAVRDIGRDDQDQLQAAWASIADHLAELRAELEAASKVETA